MEIKRLWSSAPGWPTVELFGTDALYPGLLIGGQLAPVFERPPHSRVLVRQFRLFDGGLLAEPVVIQQGERRTGVFIYPEVSAAAGAHFAGASILLAREGDAAVYYAPGGLPDSTSRDPLEPLTFGMFRATKESLPRQEYAVWWPTVDEPRLPGSPTAASIARAFGLLDGISSAMFTVFLQSLGIDGSRSLHCLDADPEIVPVVGPEDVPMFLCASSERGVTFALPTSTSTAYRQRLWREFAVLCEWAKERVLEDNPRLVRAEERGHPMAWWLAQYKLHASLEGKADLKLGVVVDG